MIEAGVALRDLTLENPIRAIREISHDLTGRRRVRLANGREASALEIQEEYLTRAKDFVDVAGSAHRRRQAGARPVGARRCGRSSTGDLGLVDREIDWVIKHRLVERYQARHGSAVVDAAGRAARPRLPRHPPGPGSVTICSSNAGLVERVSRDIEVFEATAVPPQTTRAKLRGDFVRRAQERRRDFTVDWVHLKLNDQAQRTVLCKDPFRSVDERVERLIQSM